MAINNLVIQENIASEIVISVIATVIVMCLSYFLSFLYRKIILHIYPRLDTKTPYLNFEANSKLISNKWKTDISISNACGEPIFNIYVFMAERYVSGNFTIRSLGSQNIKRTVLGIHDSLLFDDLDIIFESCNLTCNQQFWIEFEDSKGSYFRTVVIPETARGDEQRIISTRRIKSRIDRISDNIIEGDYKKWISYSAGRALPAS